MKFLTSQISFLLKNKPQRRNFKLLFRFLLILLVMILVFTLAFHLIMLSEGRYFSWVTGLYWTFTVMTTLGFGDITFESDWGRVYTMVVLLSGMLFLLVLFPFTFINFFYSPWMKAQEQARVPKQIEEKVKGHVILTHFDPVSDALIKKLKRIQIPYVMLVQDFSDGLKLREMDINVMLGDLDDPETYRNARVEAANLVATTSVDVVNTSVAFTIREVNDTIPIIATCNAEASSDILSLAGCNHVLSLGEMMGLFLSRRASGGDASALTIGQFEELSIAEATVGGSTLVGQTLRKTKLREQVGVSVLGFWVRGKYQVAHPDTEIAENSVLVLAGTATQIAAYNSLFCIQKQETEPLIIIGGGRVGRSTGRALEKRNLNFKIIEKLPDRIKDNDNYIYGDAANLDILLQAGILKAPSVIITTHEDDINAYLTIYCRKLRPDIQIITRSTLERNLDTMHRAGADFVMSYASMGANAIYNLLKKSDILMVAEGLDLIKIKAPGQLTGKSIASSCIRQETGCSIIAIKKKQSMIVNPNPETVIDSEDEIILIGTAEAENKFFKKFD
ncbi:potassium channel family protein [Cyclobacterium plantarum]|uniref:Potassium channel protein n=2 Tax=Cyclobacterium TaxID=68288 RepID=A0ABX0HDS1_9BACT|nr:potassium channel protein [Cyclobacterium plantarum]NHE58130.1 potassium channel protein [Cyclobacterium plantarum]